MDVHPTKNVSIGIDPYPYIYIYIIYLLKSDHLRSRLPIFSIPRLRELPIGLAKECSPTDGTGAVREWLLLSWKGCKPWIYKCVHVYIYIYIYNIVNIHIDIYIQYIIYTYVLKVCSRLCMYEATFISVGTIWNDTFSMAMLDCQRETTFWQLYLGKVGRHSRTDGVS